KILKSNAANIDQSNGSNAVLVTTTFIDSSAQGFYGYSATFNGFSKFALVDPPVALPVNCLDFKALKVADNVGLTWKVANDVTGSNYDVERSTDGNTYTKVGTVAGNSSGQYSFPDKSIAGLQAAYYR